MRWAAFAALLLLGPRIGKYDGNGKPRAIPGHSMPLVGLGVAILWVGWYGFNAGSTFGTTDNFMAEVALNTQLAAAAGVVAACMFSYLKTKSVDVGMAGNGAIAGLVAITAPSGYVEFWAAPIIGFVGGMIVVYGVYAIDKRLDDPVGALSAHGLAGHLGNAGGRPVRRPAPDPRRRRSRASGTGSSATPSSGRPSASSASRRSASWRRSCSCSRSPTPSSTRSRRRSGCGSTRSEEVAGLDISSHGMYGYPESFIPPEEYPGGPDSVGVPVTHSPTAVGATAMTADRPTEKPQL